MDDHDRPLNDRGRHEAPIAGGRLAESLSRDGDVVDLALVSTAVRAQETWAMVDERVAVRQARTTPQLYLAELDELLEIVRALPESAGCALFVGHNNGLEDLASALAVTNVTLKTSSFAILASDAPWERWAEGQAELREVVIAR